MKKASIFIILVLAIGAIFYFWQVNKESKLQDFSSDGNKINLSFQFSEEDIKEITFEFKTPLNLAEITQHVVREKNWEYEFKNYGDMGILVTKIKDKKNGQEQKYWQYFIDDEQPQISVDKYFPPNDSYIEWKFIKSEF